MLAKLRVQIPQRLLISSHIAVLLTTTVAEAALFLASDDADFVSGVGFNVDGGAIAITHPLAATGSRITIHLLHELRRRGARYGLGSACIGGGQGGAVVVEAL